MAADNKVVTSAVVVSLPKDLWGPIQAIREKHDKAYKRWMPHINMLYPFVPEVEFPSASNKLKEALASFAPFTVKFNKLGYFEHTPSSCTMWTGPETEPPSALQDLEKTLLSVFPHCTDLYERGEGEFMPHLTLGQFKGKFATEKQIKQTSWQPIVFTVNEIYIISRSGDSPFTIKHSIPLLGRKDAPAPAPAPRAATPPAPTMAAIIKRDIPAEKSDPVSMEPNPENECVKRIVEWFDRLLRVNPPPIPKTRPKLISAIIPMCHCTYTVKVDYILRYLERINFISISENSVVFSYKAKSKQNIHIPDVEPTITAFPEILAQVEMKAREWCLSQLIPPKTVKSMTTALNQLTKIRKPIDAGQIVDVAIGEGHLVEYPDGCISRPSSQ